MSKAPWPMVSLFDVCRPKQWPTIPQSALADNGYPVYGANGKIGYYPEYNHQRRTILITCRGATCGTINVSDPKSYVTGNAMALDDLEESRVDLRFLVYALRHDGLAKAITGTAQPQITRQSLAAVSVPLPFLAEQRRIATILDKVEELRAKRRDALRRLDVLAQSIFLEVFGDPATNPNGWVERPMRDLVSEFRYGTSNKSQGHGRPALRIPNVVGGVIDLSDLKRVPVDPNEFERLQLIEGDVLFVRTNGNPDYVGRCAIFRRSVVASSGFSAHEFVFASYLIRARLKLGKVSPIFLREFMLSPHGRSELRSRSKTSAGQFNVNTEGLGAIMIPVPRIGLQDEFARRVAAVEKLKTTQRASLAHMDMLFASLQYRAFRGEL